MTGAAGAGPARIIDGTAISREIYAGLRERVSVLGRGGVRPGLAAVQVGDNPASEIYLRNKVRACDAVGIHSEVHHLAAGSPQDAAASAPSASRALPATRIRTRRT